MNSTEIVFGSGGFIGSHYATFLRVSNANAKFVADSESFLQFVDDPHSLGIKPTSNIIWLEEKLTPLRV